MISLGNLNLNNQMSLLPTKAKPNKNNQNNDLSLFKDLKSGNKQKAGDFIWSYLESVYAITYIATTSSDIAEILTIQVFQQAFDNLNKINLKEINYSAWEWLSSFIVLVCASYHEENSGEILEDDENMDSFNDDISPFDWETTIVLGPTRMKKCLATLTEEQQKVYLLRHKLDLKYNDIASILNYSLEKVTTLLFRSRIQIVKCLGKG